jgi:hypothetical protein
VQTAGVLQSFYEINSLSVQEQAAKHINTAKAEYPQQDAQPHNDHIFSFKQLGCYPLHF